MNGGFPEDTALSKMELANTVAHIVLNMFTVESANFIGLECDKEGVGTSTMSDKLAADYVLSLPFGVNTTKVKAMVATDGSIALSGIGELVILVSALTVDLWKAIPDQERKRAINTIIQKVLEPVTKLANDVYV